VFRIKNKKEKALLVMSKVYRGIYRAYPSKIKIR